MAPPAKRTAAKAAASAPNKKKVAGGGGGKRLPPKIQLPEGLELVDLKKQSWRVGRVIGEGGFGLVYLGTGTGAPGSTGPPVDCVIKAEPKGNGPLFCEMHFYQRAADGTKISDWANAHRLDYVGVPRFYGCGHVTHSDHEHRFLAIERLGDDLEKQFDTQRDSLGRVPPRRAFAVAVRVLDALKFVHDSGYAHADVKASNLLTSGERVYLADFGLAFRYHAEGRWLKEEKEDPKRRHDGTSEFCSRDAHRGLAPTPRADLENFGWCLLAWLTGELPWQPFRDNHELVQRAKEAAVTDLAGFLRGCQFARGAADADAVAEVLRHADGLGYHERPQYARLRDLLRRRADAPDVAGAAAAAASSSATNGAVRTTAKKTAAESMAKSRPGSVAKASPRSKVVAKVTSPQSETVAKASPRSKAVAKATSPKSETVAKPSPRSKAVAKVTSTSKVVAMAASSSGASSSSVEASTNGAGVAVVANGVAEATRKRKSGCCQTSPHLLKEAKRLARAARK